MAVVTSHSLNPEKGPYNKNNTKIIPTVPSENNTVKIVVTLFPFLDFLIQLYKRSIRIENRLDYALQIRF